jgi:predicted nucleotidyltransferase
MLAQKIDEPQHIFSSLQPNFSTFDKMVVKFRKQRVAAIRHMKRSKISTKFNIFELMNLIEQNISTIEKLCESHMVNHLYVFGSILTNKFSEKSDIDLIVTFKEIELLRYADNYFDFKFSLEDILKRPVDLLEEKAIRNPYFKQSIDKQKKLIYG